ncbi:CDP-alcohol phosphatidyltransferase family protein [Spirochaetota bacterium]
MTNKLFSKKSIANWVTIFRIVSVLFPCWIILKQPKPTLNAPPENTMPIVIALIAFIIIGVTDYIDGYFARKYGSTDFGQFLDPLSDKIFTIATFLTAAQWGLVPFWPVPLVLLRESIITELRSLSAVAKCAIKTSDMGKYKTNVQGWGSGVLLLLYITWDNLILFEAIIGTAAVVITFLMIFFWIRTRKLSLAWIIGALSLDSLAIGRLALPTYDVILYLFIFMMLFTVYSGIEYMYIALKPTMAGLLKSNQKNLFTVSMLNSIISIIVPLVPAVLGLYQYVWAAVAISFELAQLGIENHISMTDLVLPYRAKLIKLLLQSLTMAAVILAWQAGAFPLAKNLSWLCLAPSLLFGLYYIVRFVPRISFTDLSEE